MAARSDQITTFLKIFSYIRTPTPFHRIARTRAALYTFVLHDWQYMFLTVSRHFISFIIGSIQTLPTCCRFIFPPAEKKNLIKYSNFLCLKTSLRVRRGCTCTSRDGAASRVKMRGRIDETDKRTTKKSPNG